MDEIDRALSDIADIRTQIADNKRFRGFGPSVIALTGCLAFALAAAQNVWPSRFAASDLQFITLWSAAALVSTALIGTEIVIRARREHGGLADAMMSNTIEQFLPAGMAGAGLTLVMFQASPETVWMLPALWQILISLGVFAALKSLPRPVAIVGGWYLLTGLASFSLASQSAELSAWSMGIPFGVGQGLMATILYFASETRHDKI